MPNTVQMQTNKATQSQQHQRRQGRRRAVCGLILGLFPAMLGAAQAAAPALGTVTASDAGQGVARFDKLELSFAVSTSALNPDLPYDAMPPSYAANLKADEDARRGVSVDCLLLPPGQTNWAKALVQPAFLYRDYVRTPSPASGDPHPNIENLVADGPDAWKVRFAPTAVGTWQYRLRVTDSGGTVMGSPQTFQCTASKSKGFVRVGRADRRYLQFDNGDSANLIGHNLFVNGYDAYKSSVDQMASGNASTLMRVWIAARSGQEIIGGFANSNGGRGWYLGSGGGEPTSQLTTEDAHTGRYSIRTPAGGELTNKLVPLQPNQSYTLSAWVKPQGGITSVKMTSEDSAGYANHRETIVPVTPGASWARVQAPIAAHDLQNGANYVSTVKFWPQGDGALLIDDVQVTDDATGADALEVGDFERHVHYNQRQSWLLDFFVEYARAHNQFLRLNALENDDSVFCDVAADGSNAPHDDANFFGASNDPAADLPVRRWQRYYARYLAARWGYATSVAEWEFCNEGPLFNGNHYAAAQSFAHAIHSWGAEGRRLASTSFWQNSSGTSYPADFYQNAALYPDIDYADIHYYPSTGVPNSSYTPYGTAGGGFVRNPTGGPNGLGALHIDAAGSSGKAQTQTLPVSRIQGRGIWTISYQVQASSDAKLNWFGRGPDLDLWCPDLGLQAYTVPQSPKSPVLPPGYGWRTVSATFTSPDNKAHDIGLTVYAKNLTQGAVDFADIKVTAPDGRLWAWYPFNEPLMDQDTASLAQYLGLAYTSLSGDPLLGKPFSVGECDIVNPDGSYNTQINQDTTGAWMRQFVWAHLNASGALIFLYTNGGEEATRKGWWRSAGAYQKFLAGVPLANGRYRNIEANSSNPNVIVVGQKDKQAGRAHFFVYNRGGTWFNLTNSPAAIAPASGVVTIGGLPDGAYRVQNWDTASGQVRSTVTIVSAGGALPVPINNLTGDTAYKIAPSGPPALSVSLKADKASARVGELVTYTLVYGNKGGADALHVVLPWAVPPGTQFVSASRGGVYDAARGEADWSLGTVAAGQTGTATLTVRVGPQ